MACSSVATPEGPHNDMLVRLNHKVHVLFRPGSLFIEGVESPHSLMAVSKGVYGEAHGEWSPQDALGFSKIVSLTGMFHARAGGK